MPDNKPHILSTSATMVGVTIMILTLIRAFKLQNDTIVDEIVAVDSIIFMLSCSFSYFVMRDAKREYLEPWADRLFIIGMFILISVVLLFTFTKL